MIDILRKTIFAGLGATVITAERLRARLDELVARGRISADEAEDMASKIMAEGRREFDEGSGRISAMLDDMVRKANVARHRDLTALEARVTILEQQLAHGAGPGMGAVHSTPGPQETAAAQPSENPTAATVPPPQPTGMGKAPPPPPSSGVATNPPQPSTGAKPPPPPPVSGA